MKAVVREYFNLLCQALAGAWRSIPSDATIVGLGIYLAGTFNLGANIGLVVMAAGIVAFVLRVLFFSRNAIPEPGKGNSLQPEIDEAYKNGYRVWLILPCINESRTRSLDALRAKGYVLTDQHGAAIDAAVEIHDSPTKRRKTFRLVEAP